MDLKTGIERKETELAHVTGAVVGLLQIFFFVALVNKICVLKAPWAETRECVVISTSEDRLRCSAQPQGPGRKVCVCLHVCA